MIPKYHTELKIAEVPLWTGCRQGFLLLPMTRRRWRRRPKKEKKTPKDAKDTDEAKPKKSEKKKDKGKKEKETKGKKPKEDTEHEMEPLVRKDDDDDEPDDESSGDGELSGVDELVALSRGKRTKKRPAASASASKQPSKRPSKKTHTKDARNADEKEARKVAIPLHHILIFFKFIGHEPTKGYQQTNTRDYLCERIVAYIAFSLKDSCPIQKYSRISHPHRPWSGLAFSAHD